MYCKETSLGFKVSSNHADAEIFVKLVEAGSRHPSYNPPPPQKKGRGVRPYPEEPKVMMGKQQ
jgi:hypothetical protein